MPRVVCDTNIYISAYNFGGITKDILELAIEGKIDVYISPPIVKEAQRILQNKFKWSKPMVKNLLAIIAESTILVIPKVKLDIIKEDPADNRILECAVAANAEIILSGDNDLKRLGNYQTIKILSPREFMDLGRLKRAA